MNGLNRFLLALFSCTLLTLGCDRPPPARQQVLRLNFTTDPATFDPRKGADIVTTAMHFFLFEGLTKLTPKGSSEPGIAKEIIVSDDGLHYEFHLRPSTWSDGHPLTAFDFEYTWKSMLSPSFPCHNAHLLYPIKNAFDAKSGKISLDSVGVKAIDPYILLVDLEKPTPYFLELCAFAVLHPVPKHLAKNNPCWASMNPCVSNGPFILKSLKLKESIILEKNPRYWEREKVSIENVHISLIENTMTALNLFEKGELDLIGGSFTRIADDAMSTLKGSESLTTFSTPGVTSITFNTNLWPLSDARFRRALGHAIDRLAIVDNVLQMGETPAYGLVHPSLKSDATIYPLEPLDFDAVLDEMGIKKEDLPPLTLQFTRSDLSNNVAQTIQQQWIEKLGLQVQLSCCEQKVFLNRLIKSDYQMALFGTRAQYMDPMNILERYAYAQNPKNYANWHSADYEATVNLASCEPDQKHRLSLLSKAEKLIMHEMPLAPVFHWQAALLSQPHIKNLHISPFGSLYLQEIAIDLDEKESNG